MQMTPLATAPTSALTLDTTVDRPSTRIRPRSVGAGHRGLLRLILAAAMVVVAVTAAIALRGLGGTLPGASVHTSQNGWPAITSGTDPRLAPFPWVTGRVLEGDVFTVFAYLAERFDAEVEPIDVGSSWGWAHRPVRGGSDLSNHASGTAIDFNATLHPLGVADTFTPAQVASIHAILDAVSPAVRWGGDYEDRKDDMHFEIAADPETVAAVAARLTADPAA